MPQPASAAANAVARPTAITRRDRVAASSTVIESAVPAAAAAGAGQPRNGEQSFSIGVLPPRAEIATRRGFAA